MSNEGNGLRSGGEDGFLWRSRHRVLPDLPANPVSAPLVSQLIRAATSIGANDCEADDAESKKDFRHKIGLCRKEARETKEQPVGPPLTVAYPALKFDMMADVPFPQAAKSALRAENNPIALRFAARSTALAACLSRRIRFRTDLRPTTNALTQRPTGC